MDSKENKDVEKMEFEDIYSDSSMEKPTYKRGHKPLDQREIVYPNKFFEFLMKNNKKNTKRLLAIIIAFLVVFLIVVGAFTVKEFINDKFNKLGSGNGGVEFTGNADYSEDYNDNEFNAVHDISDAASLDDLLKKWSLNGGDKMSQKYIINVLLIGIDGKNGVKNGGNSDSMILVSINKKTNKINLVSFMRDSRSYFEVNGRSYCTKVNATYARGGAAATVKALEDDYKIKIDYYAAVDFTTFPKVVDALGGITVDIQEYEQKYINRTTTAIKKIPNYGKVKLNGAQTLVYSRIRHSDADSDVSRTRRQRTVITALIQSAKGASVGQLNNAIDTLLPYISTDCPKNKILSYGAQAIAQGWMNFDIVQLPPVPDTDARAGVNLKGNGGSQWIVDYPLAAQTVQKFLYGETNIELSANRITAFDYVKYNTSSSGSSSGSGSSSSGSGSGSGSDSDGNGSTTHSSSQSTTVSANEETTTKRSVIDFFGKLTTAPETQQQTTAAQAEDDNAANDDAVDEEL